MTQAHFDLALGRTRKSAVMLEFEMRAKVWLDKADAAAQKIVRSRGEDGVVTMDDVKAEIGEPVGVHPHAAGALFNRKHWESIETAAPYMKPVMPSVSAS